MIRPPRTSSPNSDTPRILAESHCLRASRSTLISSGQGEAGGTDDVAVSEVRHTAVMNSKNSVLSGRIESVLSMKITQAILDDLIAAD